MGREKNEGCGIEEAMRMALLLTMAVALSIGVDSLPADTEVHEASSGDEALLGEREHLEELAAAEPAGKKKKAAKKVTCPVLTKPQAELMGKYAKFPLCDDAIMASKKEALIEPFMGMKLESIDLIFGNQALMRKFDFFEKRWRRTKKENAELHYNYEKLTEETIKAKRDLREEKLDYGALTVALKMEYHDIYARNNAFTKFKMAPRSFLTQEQIELEAKAAGVELKPNKNKEGLIVAKAEGAAKGGQTELLGESEQANEKLLPFNAVANSMHRYMGKLRSEAQGLRRARESLGDPAVVPDAAKLLTYNYTKLPRMITFNGDTAPPGTRMPDYKEQVVEDIKAIPPLRGNETEAKARLKLIRDKAAARIADAVNTFKTPAAKKASEAKDE